MTARDIIKRLKADGWYEVKGTGGSHVHFKHDTKPGKITVPDHGSKDIKPGTLKSIAHMAGIKLP